MNMTTPNEALPAAYCGVDNVLFTYEVRDLFAGELFCPSCTCRTNPEHRAHTLRELRGKHPGVPLYQLKTEFAIEV
jgi:hypothetical protein